MSEELNFDLKPVEVPVKIGEQRYVLREASEEAARQWNNAKLRAARMNADGKTTSIEGLADAEPLLVSLCLCLIDPKTGEIRTDRNLNPVTVALATVLGWPARVVKPLYEKALAISNLDGKDTPEALEAAIANLQERLAKLRGEDLSKNSPSATTTSSDSLANSGNTSTS